MKTYGLVNAIRQCQYRRDLCFRPYSCVGTGNGVMFYVRGRYIEPALPRHLPTLLGRWVVQSINSVEKEERDKAN